MTTKTKLAYLAVICGVMLLFACGQSFDNSDGPIVIPDTIAPVTENVPAPQNMGVSVTENPPSYTCTFTWAEPPDPHDEIQGYRFYYKLDDGQWYSKDTLEMFSNVGFVWKDDGASSMPSVIGYVRAAYPSGLGEASQSVSCTAR